MRTTLIALIAAATLAAATSHAQTLTDSSLTVTQIVTGLNIPTAIAFLNTNDILVLEKDTGQVRRVIDGVLQTNPVLDVNVENEEEQGLLGIALHPQFPSNPLVYLYYSESTFGFDTTFVGAAGNRVYRYTWDGTVLTNGQLILDLPAEVEYHLGGTLAFGPDGKLYTVIGDQEHFCELQNLAFCFSFDDTSVIFRLNDDGTTPTDNPFFGGTDAGDDKYFAYGVRNSFGLAFDPVTGNLWETENGENDYDEVNLVPPGFNSGWRELMGPDSRSPGSIANLVQFTGAQYSDPEFSWLTTVGLTGIAFLNSGALGEQYRNDLFVGDYNNGFLYHFDLNAGRTALVLAGGLSDKVADSDSERDSTVIGTGFSFGEGTYSGVSDMKVGPDGRLYVVSIGTGIIYAISAKGTVEDHNLSVLSVKPPKKITLSETKPSQTKPVKLQIQNLGNHTETIGSADTLTNVVQFAIESLGGCPLPAMSLVLPKNGFPILLAPKKKLTVVYNITFVLRERPTRNDQGQRSFGLPLHRRRRPRRARHRCRFRSRERQLPAPAQRRRQRLWREEPGHQTTRSGCENRCVSQTMKPAVGSK